MNFDKYSFIVHLRRILFNYVVFTSPTVTSRTHIVYIYSSDSNARIQQSRNMPKRSMDYMKGIVYDRIGIEHR